MLLVYTLALAFGDDGDDELEVSLVVSMACICFVTLEYGASLDSKERN